MRALIPALLGTSPLLLHLAVVHGSRTLMAVFLGLVLVGLIQAGVSRRQLAVAAALAALALALDPAVLGRIALAGPALVFLTLAWVFGRTLVRGRTPLIERISRVERGGDVPQGLLGYTRGLTVAWTALLAGVPSAYALLASLGRTEAASFVINIASYPLVAVLFFGEYAYRLWRYPQYPHKNPLAVARNLVRRAPELLRERG